MNRQSLLYLLLAASVTLIRVVSPLERISYEYAEFSIYVALAGILCTAAASIVALINFRKENSAINRANTITIAALPLAGWLLLFMFDSHANVHGIELPALFLYTAISELCALILFIAFAVRALRN
jgi:hypothetical protein